MIPKIIHYCWFGGNSLPPQTLAYIESWKRNFPDYELKEWNESNSPMHIDYMQQAYENENWANLSNFVRLYAIKEYGGIYFDTDIEVLKPFDFLEEGVCYLCLDSKPDAFKYLVNNAVIVADKGNSFIRFCVESFLFQFDGLESADLSSPVFITRELEKMGFKGNPGLYNGVHVLPNYFFYPASWNEKFELSMVTDNTYTIHYCEASWLKLGMDNRTQTIQLIKDLDNYKNKYRKLKSGKITFQELTKINLRFFRALLSRLVFRKFGL